MGVGTLPLLLLNFSWVHSDNQKKKKKESCESIETLFTQQHWKLNWFSVIIIIMKPDIVLSISSHLWFLIADLLYKDYQTDQKFAITTYTANGIVSVFHFFCFF